MYTSFLILQSRKARAKGESDQRSNAARPSSRRWVTNGILVLVGLGLLVVGSQWLVKSAVSFAQYLGVSELIIGLTIVAAGTSLPELVTSVVAAIRGERDIAVGNVVGSNIFNLMAVLGSASIVATAGIEVSPSVLRFDLPVMIAVAFACLPIFLRGNDQSSGRGFIVWVLHRLYAVPDTSGDAPRRATAI